MSIDDDDDDDIESALPLPSTVEEPGLETQGMQARLQERLFDTPTTVTLGDYVIVRPLGEGAMGKVYLAYDPDLDRRVAIKVIHRSHSISEHATSRMEREARAMARLSHPHVVTVHEVGVADGQVFVAMEYVEGQTLAQWCRSHPPGSRARFEQLLDWAVQAARGLAAAHAAELVHRDLKPANILVGDDGRLRIADFGLARPRDDALDQAPSPSRPPTSGSRAPTDASAEALAGRATQELSDDARLTATGEIVGTPAYMAPEQFLGRSDERSDQFSWCVTFFEAMYGVRPFAGTTVQQVRMAIEDGQRIKPPSVPHVPGWLRHLLERGLASDPSARWPSMATVVAEITRRRSAAWRRMVQGTGLVALGIASALLYQRMSDAGTPCPSAAPQLEQAWGPERQAEIRDAFIATEVPYAQDSWERVERGLDEVAADWVQAKAETCRALDSPDLQQVEQATRRQTCLDRARQSVEFASDQLAQADAQTVRASARTVAGLHDRIRCDEPLLFAPNPDGTQDTDLITETLAVLDRAMVLKDLHRLEDARATLEETLAQLPAEGLVRLRALAYQKLVEIGITAENHEAVERDAHRFIAYAERSSDPSLHASAWIGLAFVARNAQQLDEATFRLERAENISTHTAVADTLRAHILAAYARIDELRQRNAPAIARRREALALLEGPSPAPNSESIEVAYALNSLANILFVHGEGQASLDALERSLVIHRRILGPDHPDTAVAHIVLANIQVRLRSPQLHEHLDEAERILRANPEFRPSLRGRIHELRGLDVLSDPAIDPSPEFREAERIYSEVYGPDHETVFYARLYRANALQSRRRMEEAAAAYQTLFGQFSSIDQPVTMATTRLNLADVEAARGRMDAALEQVELARPVLEVANGGKGPQWSGSMVNLARVYRLCAKPEIATELLDRVRAATENSDDLVPAHTRYWLNIERAELALDRGDRAQVNALAAQTRALAEGGPPLGASLKEQLSALEQAVSTEDQIKTGDPGEPAEPAEPAEPNDPEEPEKPSH